ncbi:MAG: DUF6340 family protein [Candidatus Azobacteroides sp.]|nr:DUF6340 family protein [Candidatus Azobacteroides sp.]
MKNNAEKILLLLLLLCTSCSSIYRFSVDIQEPAPVTLPVSAQNVLILNNAVVQPKGYGIERTFDGQSIPSDYLLSLDSLIWPATDEIAAVLNESNFFNTVAIYQKPLRTDSDRFSQPYLSPELQSDFYDSENFDALFVINQLLFSLKEDINKNKVGILSDGLTAFVDLRADGVISCSMYTYGDEKPITTFNISDSLFFKSMVNIDPIVLLKEIPEYVFRELSIELGNQAAKRFIPTWKTSDRTLFTGSNSRMQEAAGYAANHQWTKAEPIWANEFEKKTKPADKAKIAFNLAVANEMQDKFESALEWAQKAKEYLKNANPNNDSKETELTDEYISELERRIQNNQLLDLQWGKEENP